MHTALKPRAHFISFHFLQHCAFHMEAFRVRTKAAPAAGGGPPSTTFLFVFHGGQPNQVALEITLKPRPTSAGADGGGSASRDDTILGRLPPSPTNGEGRVTMTLGGMSVPHLPGEPYSCHIHQVGSVTFNPRKQVRWRGDSEEEEEEGCMVGCFRVLLRCTCLLCAHQRV